MKTPNITIAIENITPKVACSMLDDNEDTQRKLKNPHVEYLAAQMVSKKWSPTANPISIADDGTLINGQHRLWAAVKVGKPVKMLVMRGQPRSDFHFIDTDLKARTAEDHAEIEGRADAPTLVPLMRWLLNAELNSSGDPNVTPKASVRLSAYEVQKQGYDSYYPELSSAVDCVKSFGKAAAFLNRKIAYYSYYQAAQQDRDLADTFFRYLITGAGDASPTMVLLRNNLMETYSELVKSRANLRSICEVMMPTIAHGWALMRLGYTTRTRNFRAKGDEAYGFEFI